MVTARTGSRQLTDRMRRAAMLDPRLYDEVEHDTTATGQAALVVVIVAVAQGIGAAGLGVQAMVLGIIGALLGWLVWAAVTWLIGDKLFGGTATWWELLRTLGFAQTPGILAILAFVPLLGGLIRLVAAIWVLVAGIIAIREALDFTTGRAVLTALIGWLALAIPAALLAAAAGVR